MLKEPEEQQSGSDHQKANRCDQLEQFRGNNGCHGTSGQGTEKTRQHQSTGGPHEDCQGTIGRAAQGHGGKLSLITEFGHKHRCEGAQHHGCETKPLALLF